MKDKPIILVVDDQLQNTELLEAHLVPHGYEIVKAASGEEALEKLSGNQIDLVLLDVMMPRMSGLEVLEKLRADKKTRLIPVVMVTALKETEDRIKALEAGCDDFISKPFDRHELLARVKSLLRIKSLHDEADEASEFAESVINTVREPLIALDQDLRVVKVSRSFCEFFKVKPEETVGKLIYDLGNKQWNIPRLRELLETILPQKTTFDNYEIEHDFETIGPKTMLLNARQIERGAGKERIILLAIDDITEHKKAQQAIEEARVYAESIVETVRESLIVLDTDLKVISANNSFYQTFKVNPEETKGRFIYDLGNRQWDIPELRELLEEILPNNSAFDDYEIEHNFKAIGPKTMLLNARRLDSVQMILIAIEDITERKWAVEKLQKKEELSRERRQAEEKIKKLYERQKSILGAVPDILMEVNNDKVYTWANQAGYDFFGEDVIGKEAAHYFEDDQKTYDIVQPVFDGKEGTTYLESWQRRKDGQKRLLAWWCVMLRDGNGKVTGSLSSAMDITERKRLDEELRTSETQYRRLFETAQDGILILDAETGMIVDVNPFLIEMLGFSHKKFAGKALWEIGLFKDIASNKDNFVELQQKGYIRYEDLPLETADGRRIDVEFVSNSYTVDHHKVIQCNIRDITERKRVQIELKKANEELLKFNDLKDEFVSMASHELRTPLSIISGAVKLLSDEIPGKIVSEQKEILDMAMNNLNRLARIVDALLNISKIESGKIELCRIDADICHLIAETVGEYSQQAGKKHINLSCQLPAHPVILHADADRIKEVIANLLSNSLKFTPEGGSINVFCEDRKDDVFIFVKDTGCGVAKNDIPRMFEKFTQFDRKVGPGEKGTGLGLAICKGLVNLHNGKIWAESDTGSGMKMSFTIPRLSAEYIFTESVDNAVASSLKTGGGAAVVLISTKPVIQIDSPQMQAILKDVSGVLERNLRRNAHDTVIQNTKEVLVVLENCDIAEAAAVCQRLTQAIECHLADKDLSSKLDLLIGYAAYPDDGQTGRSLIEKAREAGVACLPSNKA